MATKVSAQEAQPDVVGNATVQRYIRRSGPNGIGAGVSSFGPLGPGVEARHLWEAHDVPEIHYVIRGHGVLVEEDEEVPLQPGDIVATPPGRRHVLIGDSASEPLVTVYVAVSRQAQA